MILILMVMKLILQLHASTSFLFRTFQHPSITSIDLCPRPASKCFMALVVSVLCAVSPRITVDTSLISLCTSKNRELRKLTTPEEWRRVRSGCVFLEIIQGQINPNGYSSYLVHYFIFTFVKKWTLGHFKFHFVDSYRNWLIVQMVIFFSNRFPMQYLDPKIAKEFQDLWVCRTWIGVCCLEKKKLSNETNWVEGEPDV